MREAGCCGSREGRAKGIVEWTVFDWRGDAPRFMNGRHWRFGNLFLKSDLNGAVATGWEKRWDFCLRWFAGEGVTGLFDKDLDGVD